MKCHGLYKTQRSTIQKSTVVCDAGRVVPKLCSQPAIASPGRALPALFLLNSN